MNRSKIHLKTPMDWILCNHSGCNPKSTRGITQVTCKLCLDKFKKPAYTRQLEKFQAMKLEREEKIKSNPCRRLSD